MGNAAILRKDAPDKELEIPNRPSIRWTVYRLRERGVKLPRNAAIAIAQTGRLEIDRWRDGSLVATLLDREGISISRLYGVQLRWLQADDRGMLLHGKEGATEPGGGLADVLQAWWCVVVAR